jgi:hypothetical protein
MTVAFGLQAVIDDTKILIISMAAPLHIAAVHVHSIFSLLVAKI